MNPICYVYWHDWQAMLRRVARLIGVDRVDLQASTTLEDLDVVETKTAQFNGAPTTHYRLKIDELVRKWQAWLDTRLSDIEQTII